MPYDPTYPANGTPAASAPMRAQLNSIVDLIQTIPVGPQGPPGPAGTSVSGAVVDGVSTVNPWDPASASAFFDGANVHFSFGIPRGNDGQQGQQGQPGNEGQEGPQGIQGPQGAPFTSFVVDGVTTLEPWQPATVTTSFDGTFVHFAFGIPRGNDGQPGPQGPQGPQGAPFTNFTVDAVTTLQPSQPATVSTSFDGTFVRFAFGIPRGNDGQQGPAGPAFTNFVADSTTTLEPWQPAYVTTSFDGTYVHFAFGIPRGQDGQQGPQGPAGPPGEVTLAQLQGAIAGTANNTNPLATLDIGISDPPTQSEVTQLLAKVNELIAALRRPIP